MKGWHSIDLARANPRVNAALLREAKARGMEPERARKAATRPRCAGKGPNATEKRFAAEFLDPLVAAGEADWYGFEVMKFRLARRCFYRPDYPVHMVHRPRFVIHEIKGHLEDDAAVKLRMMPVIYPELELHVWRWSRSARCFVEWVEFRHVPAAVVR